jgi:hypothetical protein
MLRTRTREGPSTAALTSSIVNTSGADLGVPQTKLHKPMQRQIDLQPACFSGQNEQSLRKLADSGSSASSAASSTGSSPVDHLLPPADIGIFMSSPSARRASCIHQLMRCIMNLRTLYCVSRATQWHVQRFQHGTTEQPRYHPPLAERIVSCLARGCHWLPGGLPSVPQTHRAKKGTLL